MTDIHLIDENLMAYADGEASPAIQQAVEAAMLADPMVVKKVVGYLRSRNMTKAAFGPETGLVPPVLRAAITAQIEASEKTQVQGTVVPLRRRMANTWGRVALPVAAASVLFAAVSIFTVVTRDAPQGDHISLVAGVEGPRVQRLLNSLPAGAEDTDERVTFRALATYRLPTGRLCRAFSLTQEAKGADVVSCREGERWAFTVAGATEPAAYVPADGANVVANYLASARAGDALSADEEAQILTN